VTPHPSGRPKAREAGPELLLLAKWEEFTGWLLDHTAKWPKSARFTLTQRIENHALDITEILVQARYQPRGRGLRLEDANLRLERMRFLLRLARRAQVESPKGFESALRGIDEAGRMLHGWRTALGGAQRGPPDRAPKEAQEGTAPGSAGSGRRACPDRRPRSTAVQSRLLPPL